MNNNITYEKAKEAANIVRGYMYKNEWCYGAKWCDETFELDYILQEWRSPNILDHSKDRDDFREEYEWIHRASTHNWHMYEDPEY